MLQRSYFETITSRINEPRKFIQIIEGPRQVGEGGISIETFLASDLKELFG